MLRNVQALRGIAATAVVVAHISDPAGVENRWLAGDQYWTGFLHRPGQAGVDLFFVISGLIMVLTTRRAVAGAGTARRFLLRRLIRIYPLYWLASAPLLLLFLARPALLNSSSDHPPRVVESLLLLPQPGLPLLMVGWTLTFELYFYVVFTGVLFLPRGARIPALGLWGALTVGLALLFAHSANPWLATVGAPVALEFLFGALVGALVDAERLPALPVLTLAAGTAATACAALGAFPGTWFRAVPVGLLLAVTVHGLVRLEQLGRWVAPRWIQAVGDASYSMYLWHILLLSALGRVILIRLPEGPVVHAGALVLMIVLVPVVSLALHRRVEQPLTAWLRELHPAVPHWSRGPIRHAA